MWWKAVWVVWVACATGMAGAGGGPPDRCMPISAPSCLQVGYNTTAMPNGLGHRDQMVADTELVRVEAAVGADCSRLLRTFLCAALVPLCASPLPRPVPPCKGLCQQVAEDCLTRRAAHTASAQPSPPPPAVLLCEQYPEPHEALCMQEPPEPGPPSAVAASEFNPAGGVTAAPPPPPPPAPPPSLPPTHAPCPPAFTRVFIPSQRRGSPDAHEADFETGEATCAPRCGSDAYYRREDKRFAAAWTAGWAWLCLLSSVFTLLTFCVEPLRFRYPERPVAFVAACAGARALALAAGGALGGALGGVAGGSVGCVHSVAGAPPHLATDALHSGACTLSFLAIYYFGLCGSAWWCVLAACWYLSAARQWSCEALHALAPYLHAAAWVPPAALGLWALASGQVHADELTGLCQVSERGSLWLMALPHGALLLTGAGLAAAGGVSLLRVRRAVRASGRSTRRLQRLTTRLAVFATLYVLPGAGALACLLYEQWHAPRWRALALLAAVDCQLSLPPGAAPTALARCAPAAAAYAAHAHVEVALLREFLWLAAGGAAGAWVWTGKTWRAWSRLLAPSPSPGATPPSAPRGRLPTSGAAALLPHPATQACDAQPYRGFTLLKPTYAQPPTHVSRV